MSTLTAVYIAAAMVCQSPSDTVEVKMDGQVTHYTIIYQMTGECGAMVEIKPETDAPIVKPAKPKPVVKAKKKRKRLPCKPGRTRNAKGICGRW